MIPTIQFVVNVMLIRLCKINSIEKNDENSFLVEGFLSPFLILKIKNKCFYHIFFIIEKSLRMR